MSKERLAAQEVFQRISLKLPTFVERLHNLDYIALIPSAVIGGMLVFTANYHSDKPLVILGAGVIGTTTLFTGIMAALNPDTN